MVGVPVFEIDVTEELRTLVLDSDSDQGVAAQPVRPNATLRVFPRELINLDRQRLRQLSDAVFPTITRPPLGEKAATAPPGALHAYRQPKPHIPRRAVSDRTDLPQSNVHSRQRPNDDVTPPLPPLPRPVIPPKENITITPNMSNRKSIGRVGSTSERHVWRLSPQASSQLRSISHALGDRKKLLEVPVDSFSGKARVKAALDRKKLDPLRTTPFVDFKSKELPASPNSMGATPQELYGNPFDNASARASPGTPALYEESPLLPVNSPPWTSRSAKHLSLPMTPQTPQRRGTLRRNSSEMSAKHDAEEERVYIPGPIRIEDEIVATPRKGSIASLEPFRQPSSHGKRFSDLVALDGIVCFFQDLGVVDESSEEGLDRYWLSDEELCKEVTRAQKGASRVPSSSPRASMQEGQRQAPSLEIPGRRRLRSLLKSSRSTR